MQKALYYSMIRKGNNMKLSEIIDNVNEEFSGEEVDCDTFSVPEDGYTLVPLASVGCWICSYAGSEIGRKSTDMPETEYLQSKGRDVMNMLKENSLTAGITSAATAGASAVSMGADKYAAHLKNPLGLKSMVDKVKEDPSLGVTLTPIAVTPGYTPPSILNTPGRLSPAPMNLVTPPAVNVRGTLAPLGNVAGGGQLGAQIAKNPSLLNYVPNLGSSGLNLQTTGVWEGHNPLSNNPLLHQPLLTLPSGIQSPAGNIHKPYMPPII